MPLTRPQYACSPLPNAVRCNDARFSCPSSTTCAQGFKCEAADGSLVNAVTNVDAFYDDPMRSFGGMSPLGARWLAWLRCCFLSFISCGLYLLLCNTMHISTYIPLLPPCFYCVTFCRRGWPVHQWHLQRSQNLLPLSQFLQLRRR